MIIHIRQLDRLLAKEYGEIMGHRIEHYVAQNKMSNFSSLYQGPLRQKARVAGYSKYIEVCNDILFKKVEGDTVATDDIEFTPLVTGCSLPRCIHFTKEDICEIRRDFLHGLHAAEEDFKDIQDLGSRLGWISAGDNPAISYK